jgi:hypothetical protein
MNPNTLNFPETYKDFDKKVVKYGMRLYGTDENRNPKWNLILCDPVLASMMSSHDVDINQLKYEWEKFVGPMEVDSNALTESSRTFFDFYRTRSILSNAVLLANPEPFKPKQMDFPTYTECRSCSKKAHNLL